MKDEDRVPVKDKLAYACGMMGWSMMIQLISVILVYLYLPPKSSGLPAFITQVTIFGIFNAVALITSGGRLVDAVYDPIIAQFSDRSKSPSGRRTPYMKWSLIPSLVFCCIVFLPLIHEESAWNIVWLSFTLAGFYVATTTFIIPYNALLPEMASTSREKVNLSSWQSVGYVFGIAGSSNTFNLIDFFQRRFPGMTRLAALQWTVVSLAVIATIFMAVSAFVIDERKYKKSPPSAVPLRRALKQALLNRNFQLFLVADFAYFIAVTVITSGLVYFITILLQLPATLGNQLVITMVGVSFLFYPVVNIASRKFGEKAVVITSLLLLSLSFAGIFFLGRISMHPLGQIYALVIVTAIPLAALGILPNAIIAELIEEDTRKTGKNQEAIYFAVRYFFVKVAQSFGIALFAMLLIYGKDIGHDTGIRLNGALGFVLCVTAAIFFSRFRNPRGN